MKTGQSLEQVSLIEIFIPYLHEDQIIWNV